MRPAPINLSDRLGVLKMGVVAWQALAGTILLWSISIQVTLPSPSLTLGTIFLPISF